MIKTPRIQTLQSFSVNKNIEIDVLRLDEIHPIVSGNKWYKLKYYLQDAIEKKCSTIITFGGAFSNHIVATAFACKANNLKSIGIIRGEEPKQLSPTLIAAKSYGMELHFVERSFYKTKQIPANINQNNDYIIAEGGYGKLGSKGVTSIFENMNIEKYTHIICACGTGTTLAGIVAAASPYQKIIGINALKGYEKIDEDIKQILPENFVNNAFEINNNYHFNGYAKYNATLINFMNELWQIENLPTDFVYTGKLFYAIKDMIAKNYFEENSKLIVVHSGGLQGNKSLANGMLMF